MSNDYFERYKKRASRTFGERLEDNTKQFYRRKMMESANAKIILVDGVETQARVANGDRIEDLEVLFYPDFTPKIGAMVQIDDTHWIIHDTQSEGVVPKGVLKRCNCTLVWTSNGIKYEQIAKVQNFYTLDMYDVEAKTLMDMDMPKGGMFAIAPYNQITKTIKHDQTFEINGQRFQVSGIDNVTKVIFGEGVVKFTLDIIVSAPDKPDEDNKTNNEGGWWS